MGYFLLVAISGLALAADPDGAALYREKCALCHDASGQTRAPAASALKMMSPENVVRALETGLMREQGASLTLPQKRAIAETVTGKTSSAKISAPACVDRREFSTSEADWNGWGNGLDNARFQATPGLSFAQIPRLTLKWAFAYADTFNANGQPSIVGGRLFVASANRNIYSLDARTGCQYWSFEAESPVRTAITVVIQKGSRPAAFFGDRRGNIYAVDASDGELLWKKKSMDHPRSGITGAPVFYDHRLFVPVVAGEEGAAIDPKYECCTGRGGVVAFDGEGKKLWQAYSIPEEPHVIEKNSAGTPVWGPSGASIWTAPTIDLEKHALYVATGDNFTHPDSKTSDAILAFDLKTGDMRWSRQLLTGDVFSTACVTATKQGCPNNAGPDFDFASSPILVKLANGKRALIIGQKSGVVHAIDPDNKGAILWQTRVGKGGILGGVQWGSAFDGARVFVAVSDVSFKEFSLGRGGTRVLDPKLGGGLYALDPVTGAKIWFTPTPPICGERPNCSPAQSAAVSAIPGAVFSGSLDGHLRAYSAADGKIVWDFDTSREFTAVNGSGRGGSIDGPGPVISGGMVFVNSGYGTFGGQPGNMLLAFSIDGK